MSSVLYNYFTFWVRVWKSDSCNFIWLIKFTSRLGDIFLRCTREKHPPTKSCWLSLKPHVCVMTQDKTLWPYLEIQTHPWGIAKPPGSILNRLFNIILSPVQQSNQFSKCAFKWPLFLSAAHSNSFLMVLSILRSFIQTLAWQELLTIPGSAVWFPSSQAFKQTALACFEAKAIAMNNSLICYVKIQSSSLVCGS